MADAARRTRYIAGLPQRGSRPGGDPSPWTARGTFLAMQVAVERHLARPLADCTVAVQGVGHVGAELAGMLTKAGARLIVADTDRAAVARVVATTGATACAPEDILHADADVLAPCALGGVLDAAIIGRLRARVICGAANNQLATHEDGARLADKGVLYAPDYVVNAGGIINVAAEYLGWTMQAALERVMATGKRLARVLDLAEASGLPTNVAADRMARSTIAARGLDAAREAA